MKSLYKLYSLNYDGTVNAKKSLEYSWSDAMDDQLSPINQYLDSCKKRELDVKAVYKYYSDDSCGYRRCYDYVKKIKNGYSSRDFSRSVMYIRNSKKPIIVYGNNFTGAKEEIEIKEQEMFKEDIYSALDKIFDILKDDSKIIAISTQLFCRKLLSYISIDSPNIATDIKLDIIANEKCKLLSNIKLCNSILNSYIFEKNLPFKIPVGMTQGLFYFSENANAALHVNRNNAFTCSIRSSNGGWSFNIKDKENSNISGLGISFSDINKFKSISNFSETIEKLLSARNNSRGKFDIIVTESFDVYSYRKLKSNPQNNTFQFYQHNKSIFLEDAKPFIESIENCKIKLHGLKCNIYIKDIDILMDAFRIKDNKLIVDPSLEDELYNVRYVLKSGLSSVEHETIIQDLHDIIKNDDNYEAWCLLNEI